MELFCKLDTISRARGTKISLPINYIKKIAVIILQTQSSKQAYIVTRQTVCRLKIESFCVTRYAFVNCRKRLYFCEIIVELAG